MMFRPRHDKPKMSWHTFCILTRKRMHFSQPYSVGANFAGESTELPPLIFLRYSISDEPLFFFLFISHTNAKSAYRYILLKEAVA